MSEDVGLDTRLQVILETIMALARGDLRARAEISDSDDALDAIIAGVNMLGEELETKQQQLLSSTAQAVHASRLAALGEMAAGVAHELNQPLNSMKLIMQGILRDLRFERYDTASLPTDAEDVVKLINRMAAIIDHMRIFTRAPESERSEDVDVGGCINNALGLVREQLRSHGVDLVTELDEDLPPVRCSSNSLEQVFINLLSNARDAVLGRRTKERQHGGRIVIRATGHDGDVCVDIEDDGVGVAEAQRERIFDPFFTTKDPGRGTGLGLSIARQIVMDFGGRLELIDAQSGAIFRVVLPAANEAKR